MKFSKLIMRPTIFIVGISVYIAFAEAVPTTADVKIKTYTWDGTTSSGQINANNIAYKKVFSVINADSSDNLNNNGNVISYSYTNEIDGKARNIGTLLARLVALKNFMSDMVLVEFPTMTIKILKSIKAITTPTTITSTSASFPSGNATISSWIESQESISRFAILRNINPAGSVTGFIAASLSTSYPDYYYSWTRDSALTSYVLAYDYNTTFAGNLTILGVLKNYVTFSINSQSVSTVCNCLGEPKFNPDGSSYTGAWGRPQNDGPAERASTFILFADSYLNQTSDATYVTDTLAPAIYKDLDYVVNTWSNGCYDLWEEVNGVHFYTLMSMRRGLLDGADFASRNSDPTHSSTYKSTAASIATKIDTFWVASGNYVEVSQDVTSGVSKVGYDCANILAANLASYHDGFYTPGSSKILATAVAIESKFSSLYSINSDLGSYLGTAIGRYPEDTYNGNGNSQGNPWFICTNAFAELYYRAISEWIKAGSVTVDSINVGFFQKWDSSAVSGTKYTVGTTAFTNLVENIATGADKFLSTVKFHAATNGSLSEEFNRDSGFMAGARDLTWSHVSMISVSKAKSGTPAP